MAESEADSPETVSRPSKAKTIVAQTEQGTEFTLRNGDVGTMIFMSIWLSGWTIGCVTLAYQSIYHFQMKLFLGGLAFWISWIAVASMMRSLFFGKQLLIISPQGLSYFASTLNRRKVISCPLNAVKNVEVTDWVVQNKNSSYRAFGVRIETHHMPIVFGKSMWNQSVTQEEAQWLCQEMQVALGLHGGDELLERVVFAEQQNVVNDPAAILSDLTATQKTFSEEELRGPRVGRFLLQDMPDGPRIDRPSDWSLSSMIASLFIAGFWNSIVGVFLHELFFNHFAWGLALFLIPFVIVGLALVGVCIASFLAPFSRQVWLFHMDAMEHHRKLFGITWRKKSMDLGRISSIAQKPMPISKFKSLAGSNVEVQKQLRDQMLEKGIWCLDFLGAQEQSLLTIPTLTDIEAAGILRLIRSRQPRWFV